MDGVAFGFSGQDVAAVAVTPASGVARSLPAKAGSHDMKQTQ